MRPAQSIPITWLEEGDPLPPIELAQGPTGPVPGLLAASATIDVRRLTQAYRQGVFPWYSAGQPVLWWSPDPRMVLHTTQFNLHRSLRKTIAHGLAQRQFTVEIDRDFNAVIDACASTTRSGQSGTWIQPELKRAYVALHRAGLAHSVEVYADQGLVGGLYLVNIGRMVYGESMFSRLSNASKIALAALVAFCRHHQLPMIDCQQETAHLARMGAQPIRRNHFLHEMSELVATPKPSMNWAFSNSFWQHLDHRLLPSMSGNPEVAP